MKTPHIPGKETQNVPSKDLPEHPKTSTDFRDSFHWRIFRIMAEFVEGFQFIADFRKTVSVFGSARFDEDNTWYEQARTLSRKLSENGFSIVTGGGPGIMEAANLGATEGKKGDSIGLNIQLPEEQRINPCVQHGLGFHYFFTRKVMLSYAAQAYVFFPGGYGTLDEFFEIVTLIQTKKIDDIPVVLVGKEFWEPVVTWMQNDLLGTHKTISKEDLEIFTLVDSIDEAYEVVSNSKERTDLYEDH